MIQVTYHRQYCRVRIEGHAHSGEPGKDLVCAGVSALAYTLAANVANLESCGRARDVQVRLDNGDAEIACKPLGKFTAITELIFQAVCVGFEMLARQYPEYIRYEIYA